METDKQIYKPNELITISGEVINNAMIARDYELVLLADELEIFSDSFTLDPGESRSFSTYTTSGSSLQLEATTGDTSVHDVVIIEEPQADISIIAPDLVGINPFEAAVLVENIGNVPADLTATMGGEVWDIVVSENETTLLKSTISTKENITINATLSGDVDRTVSKEVVCGENVTISVTPPPRDLEGSVEIPFLLENVGVLDSGFDVNFSMNGESVQRSVFVPVNDSVNGSVSFNLTQGQYLFEYSTPFEEHSLLFDVLSPENISLLSIHPNETTGFMVGEYANISFEFENTGGVEGPVNVEIMMLEYEDSAMEWVRPGERKNVSFRFMIPEDLGAGSYMGYYKIDGERGEFAYQVHGINLTVNAELDKELYEENEVALLTIEVVNECLDCNVSSLYARAKLGDYDEIQHFNLTDSEIIEFSVPVQFNGQKLFYGIYKDTGRSIHLNALYVHENEPVALYTGKQVYSAGETVTVFVNVPNSGTLDVSAPGFNNTIPVSNQTTFDFTLPDEMRSGTYFIIYSFNNQSYGYPFDVKGYSAEILEASLDKNIYDLDDVVEVNLTIKTDPGMQGRVLFEILDFDYNVIESSEVPYEFLEGENKVQESIGFVSPLPGIKVLSYSVYTNNSLLLASGEEYFEIPWNCEDEDGDGYNVTGHLCGPVDCNDDDPSINPEADEICNGNDDNCDGEIDEGGNSLCDDGLFCNGQEICSGTCINGIAFDCSANNIPGIGSCVYDPDNNSATWDYAEGFISQCNDLIDQCTVGSVEITHACDMVNCGAECETDEDCEASSCSSLDGCYQGIYRTYEDSENTCLENCSCKANNCTVYIEEEDADGDGYSSNCGDCDDSNPLVNQDEAEICDGIDNNCDGVVDEGCSTPKSLKLDSVELLEESKTPISCDEGSWWERLKCYWEHRREIIENLAIGEVIWYIESSLNNQYWLDDKTLDSDRGRFVFMYENGAASRCRIPGDVCDEVAGNLVEADARLAEKAFATAEDSEVTNEDNIQCYESAIQSAQEMIEDAENAYEPEDAIRNYGDAWRFSQKAIQYAESSEDICS
jgi:hypothetical protein